jgi:hypothetical protein
MIRPSVGSSRFRRHAFVLAITAAFTATFVLVACTSDAGSPDGGEDRPRTSPPPVTSADSYVYTDAAGIEARLRLEGSGASLTVRNETGGPLPEPGVYVLDARDGSRVDWRVLDAASVPDGERAEFSVERPAVPEPKHIGLVVLLVGGEDLGAFVPPRAGGQA